MYTLALGARRIGPRDHGRITRSTLNMLTLPHLFARRPWERCCLARWLAPAVQSALLAPFSPEAVATALAAAEAGAVRAKRGGTGAAGAAGTPPPRTPDADAAAAAAPGSAKQAGGGKAPAGGSVRSRRGSPKAAAVRICRKCLHHVVLLLILTFSPKFGLQDVVPRSWTL